MIHEGHRQRMYEKLEKGEDLYDHELLEILLYSVCPRVNTNPVAHALLDRFVTISEVFGASIEELKKVPGVGESVARYLKAVGQCAERAGSIDNAPSLKTFGDCKRFVHLRLSGRSEEHIELYFLNKACRVQRIFDYTVAHKSRAAANMDVIARNVALFRPHGIVIAHNHLNGDESPSDYDDEFTQVVQFICNMNEVQLLDHVVYISREKVLSYSDSGRLKKVQDKCSWETFEKWIKTLN